MQLLDSHLTDHRNTDPETVCELYKDGFYPMGYGETVVIWRKNSARSVFNLNAMTIPRSTRREVLNRKPFDVTIDEDFSAVLHHCSRVENPDEGVWLNKTLKDAFTALHDRGYVHSVECRRDGALAGGLFGIAMGKVFFGESMFSLQPNASKVALTHLAARLWKGGFTMLDSQTATGHLQTQFGLSDLPAYIYEQQLHQALQHQACFDGPDMPGESALAKEYLDFLREQKQAAHNAPAAPRSGPGIG